MVSVVVTKPGLKVAVTVAVWTELTEPPVAVNGAEAELAGTVTEPGTLRADGLFDESVMVVPPVGAFMFRLTVHVELAPVVRVDGLQDTEVRLGVPPPPFGFALKAAIWAR